MISRSLIFNHLACLIILFPVIFSFVFKVIGLPIPSYLFIIILVFIIVFCISNDLLEISKDSLKLVFYLFFIWVFFGITYTPSVIASESKFIDILYNTILPVLLIELFFLSSKQKEIELKSFDMQLLRYSYILVWFSLVAFILFKQPGENGRYTLPGVLNAIWFSRFLGMLVLIVLCRASINMRNLAFFLLTIIFGLFLMFAGGSRGPVIAVLIVYLIKQSYFIKKRNLVLLLLGIIVFIIIGFIFIGGYLFETDFYSLYARLDLFEDLTNFDFNYIKGAGIGSFAFLISGEDIRYYPHNVFLEIFFENGIVGILLFSILLFLFFRSFKPNMINLLCLYFFISSLVSGDLPGNNNFYILLYLSIYANRNYLQQNKLLSVNN
jgi:hypothetical protein